MHGKRNYYYYYYYTCMCWSRYGNWRSNGTFVSIAGLLALALYVLEGFTQRLASLKHALNANACGHDIVEVLHIAVLVGVLTTLVAVHILLHQAEADMH